MKKTSFYGPLFVLMAAILWGTTGSAQAFAPSEATPLAIGSLRMVMGGSTLLLFSILKGTFKTKRHWNKKLVVLGAVSMAAYQPFFFAGVSMTGIAFGTVLAIGSAPIFTGMIEFLKGTKLSIDWIFSTLLAIIGCVLLFGGQNAIEMNLLGAVFSLGAGLSYACYVQATKALFNNYPRDAVNGLIFFLSGVLLIPILLTQDLSWVLTTRGFLVSLHLGLFATALAYTFFGIGLVHVSSPTAVTLTLGEPLTAALLGIIVFKEQLSIISVIGIVLIFIGLLFSALSKNQTRKKRSFTYQ